MIHSGGGYTILELIVSISIITIMLGVVVGVYSLGKPFDTIRGDTDRLTAALANVRNRAFNSAQFQAEIPFCSLNPSYPGDADGCLANDECQPPSAPGNFGHCTNLSYPPLGYGIHITQKSGATTYTTFADLANADGALPFLDKASERMETVTSTAKFIFRGSQTVTEAEIIFNHASSTVTIYESNGGTWQMVDVSGVNPETYQIQIEDFGSTPGCVKGKRGQVTVEGRAMRIYAGLVSCP